MTPEPDVPMARAPVGPLTRELGYHPALDGVRGLSVAMVLGFHLEVPWLAGGYLGVSVFFTLSGFLITTLLLEERARSGHVDLARFYERRARRLLPASLLALAGICVLAGTEVLAGPTSLRRDVFASLGQVLNWTELVGDRGYADLFASPSPVAHYWSLGIEEQFYLVWPPAVVVLLAWGHRQARSHGEVHPQGRVRSHGSAVVVLTLWLVAAVAAPVTARLWSPAAAYYATWARASELLSGAVVAALLVGRPISARVRWLAPCGLVAVVGAAVLTPAGHGWAFDGGLPLFSLASAALMLGLLVPGPATRALAWRPIVQLGRISYGLYVYHWPVFLVLDEDRTDLDGWSLGVVRVAVALLVAVVSFVLVERPIRERRFLRTRKRLLPVLGTGVLGVVVAALVVPVPEPPAADPPPLISAPTTSTAPAQASTAPPTTRPAPGSSSQPGSSTVAPLTGPPPTSPPETSAPRPVAIAIFGDSLPAWLLRDAAPSYSRTDVVVVNGSSEGCDGMIDLPVGRDRAGTELRPPDDCGAWDVSYPAVLETLGSPVDVAVLLLGVTAVFDHFVDGRWVPPCESIEWYLADLRSRIAYLQGRGLAVVFAVPATPGVRSRFTFADDYVDRMACVRADLSAMLTSGAVPVIDLAVVLCPAGDCDVLRTRDGLHVDAEHAPAVLDWLIDAVLAEAGVQPGAGP